MESRSDIWAMSFVLFAAIMMIMIGTFQAFDGLVAIFEDEFFAVTPNYILSFDVTTWGWIHLILGIVVVFAGVALLSGATWARIVGIIMAMMSAIANFAFIPYYPIWSLAIIALNIAVIWALTVHGRDAAVANL
jgi:hypothetical protein